MKIFYISLGAIVTIAIAYLSLKTYNAIKYCDNEINSHYPNYESRTITYGDDRIRFNYKFPGKIITLAYKYSDLFMPYIPGINSPDRDGPYWIIDPNNKYDN